MNTIDGIYGGVVSFSIREWLQEAREHCNVSNFEVFLVATKRDLVVRVAIVQFVGWLPTLGA